jgi:DNA anti-recombination protein RmuC
MSDLNAKINQLLIILAEKQECFRTASIDDKLTLQPEIDGLQSDLQYLEEQIQAEQIQAKKQQIQAKKQQIQAEQIQAEQIQARKLAAFRRFQNHTRPHRVHQLDMIHKEARHLFEKKNKDYGDAFATYGPVGVLVRIGDKIQRLQSINKTGITMVQDERIRDTLIDLHNYAAMAIMLIDE